MEDRQQRVTADRQSRWAAIAMATSLPTDIVLYLMLPMYAADFGVTLPEVGMLLAANRLVRIAGYGWVTRFYARHGERATCLLAVVAAAGCSLGYATLIGFWWLLPLRLVWGLSFAGLNLTTQALATSCPEGAAARAGRSRAYIALGPVIALPAGAALALAAGPRAIFALLVGVALCGLLAARLLRRDHQPEPPPPRARPSWPDALSSWSFLEGFTLDGLFIIGLPVLGRDLLPGGAVMAAGVVMALRYAGEIALSPVGGRMADRWGAERLLVVFSLMTCGALVGFGLGWLWSCAAAIMVLRALQLPLLAPIVAHRNPGPARVRALASRSIWRDIGAGTGPLVAGVALSVVSTGWLYAFAAGLLALAAVLCVKRRAS